MSDLPQPYHNHKDTCFGFGQLLLEVHIEFLVLTSLTHIASEERRVLKERPTTTSVLSLPNGHDHFVVYSDASSIGLGCVLMQRGRLIIYTSRQLKIHEHNYPRHDLKLAVVLFELRIWRHYLYSMSFQLFTNQKVSSTTSR